MLLKDLHHYHTAALKPAPELAKVLLRAIVLIQELEDSIAEWDTGDRTADQAKQALTEFAALMDSNHFFK